MTIRAHQLPAALTEAQVDTLIAAGSLGQDRVKRMNYRGATGHVRFAGNILGGDTVTVTSPGGAVTYTFGGGAPQDPAVGGSAALSAGNLAAAINGVNGNTDVTATARAVGDIGGALQAVDLIVDGSSTAALTLAESTAGVRTVVQDNANEIANDEVALFCETRTCTAEDVGRGNMVFDFGLATIQSASYLLQTSVANRTAVAHTGAISVVGGVVTIDNSGGAPDYGAGNVITVFVFGAF